MVGRAAGATAAAAAAEAAEAGGKKTERYSCGEEAGERLHPEPPGKAGPAKNVALSSQAAGTGAAGLWAKMSLGGAEVESRKRK